MFCVPGWLPVTFYYCFNYGVLRFHQKIEAQTYRYYWHLFCHILTLYILNITNIHDKTPYSTRSFGIHPTLKLSLIISIKDHTLIFVNTCGYLRGENYIVY